MASIKSKNDDLIMYGEEMHKLSKDFLLKIDKFFNLIESVNRTSWLGTSANKYSSIVSQDRKIYENFGNEMMQYASSVKNAGKSIGIVMKKWDDK